MTLTFRITVVWEIKNSSVLFLWNFITRVPDHNGISRLYNMLEIYHSGPEPSINFDKICVKYDPGSGHLCTDLFQTGYDSRHDSSLDDQTMMFTQFHRVTGKLKLACSFCCKWLEATQLFKLADCVREVAVKKSCKYGECGLLEHLLFSIKCSFLDVHLVHGIWWEPMVNRGLCLTVCRYLALPQCMVWVSGWWCTEACVVSVCRYLALLQCMVCVSGWRRWLWRGEWSRLPA